jgi:uncharacterized protein YjgD (DUF1641 family)
MPIKETLKKVVDGNKEIRKTINKLIELSNSTIGDVFTAAVGADRILKLEGRDEGDVKFVRLSSDEEQQPISVLAIKGCPTDTPNMIKLSDLKAMPDDVEIYEISSLTADPVPLFLDILTENDFKLTTERYAKSLGESFVTNSKPEMKTMPLGLAFVYMSDLTIEFSAQMIILLPTSVESIEELVETITKARAAHEVAVEAAKNAEDAPAAEGFKMLDKDEAGV